MLGTNFNLIDQSQIPSIEEAVTVENSPIVLAACPTEKGIEDMQVIGDEFFTMYGNPNFKKFGQMSIQVADIVKAGGKVLFKRIVADDATLGNIIISAKVARKQVQKVNDAGLPLYEDSVTHKETTEASENTPIMIDHALIRYEASSVSGASDFATVLAAAEELLDNTGTAGVGDESTITWFTYPLYVITDNGRGSCSKRIRIVPEYELSKKLNMMLYTLQVLENTAISEHVRFSIETDAEYNGACMELGEVVNTSLKQIKATNLTDSFDLFKAKVAEFSGYDATELEATAYLVGKTKKKLNMELVEIDTTAGIDFTIDNGLGLSNGTAGKLANGISTTEGKQEWEARLLEFFGGEFDDNIFNLDIYSIAACFDACLPKPVKRKIEELALFRQDMVFYEDLGLDINSLYDVRTAIEEVAKSKFVSVWSTVYDVKDTYSKKQITVNMLYEMAPKLITHLKNNPSEIFAGYRYDAVLERAIKGTVKFFPKILPTEDQKSEMEELRANFAYYYGEDLVVESGYTTQEEFTQLSYVNNVTGTLEVVRGLRKYFPRSRYQYISTTDLTQLDAITEQVNDYLSQYSPMFEELRFEYVEDTISVANKIYRAALYVRYKDFEQGELVDVYALPTVLNV